MKKTTISKIAAEAGVPRQTPYNAFASKEDLMCDAMSHYAQGAVDAIQDDCDDVEDILDRLDVAYHHLARDVGHLNAQYETLKKALKPTLGVT